MTGRAREDAPRDHLYHHGDLRRALLAEAVRAIGEAGPAAVSLRALARRAGVSHAAPAHHFGDKAGLLAAVAAEGYRLLAADLARAWAEAGSFLDVGVAYVRFALERRSYFAVMFRPELYDPADPEVAAARGAARALLYGPPGAVAGPPDAAAREIGLAAWSLAHGFATLWLDGNLVAESAADPEHLARAVLAHLERVTSDE